MQIRTHKIYTIPELMAMRDDPDRWIIPNMIPAQGRVMVHGSGGSFKSTMLFDAAVAISSGGLLMEHFSVQKHGPVLLISTEGSIFDNKARITAHLRARNLAPSQVQMHYCQEPFMLDEPSDVAELDDIIGEIKPILVILDPLDSFFSGDENSAKETKPLRRAANDFIRKHNCAVALIHHNRKDSTEYRGSTAWRGWIDSQLKVDRADVDVGLAQSVPIVAVEAEKMRNGREGKLFSFAPVIGDDYLTVRFAYYDGKDKEAVAQAFIQQRVYKALVDASDPMLATEICELTTLVPARVAAALAGLEEAQLAAKDAAVKRSTSKDGSRSRTIPAWRPLRKLSMIDAAAVMMRMDSKDQQHDEDCYHLDPLISSHPAVL